MLTRRELLKSATAAAVAAPMINRGRYALRAGLPAEYSARAMDLVGSTTTLDMLSPISLSNSKFTRWMTQPATFTAVDFARYRDSAINVFHIAVGIGGPDAHMQTLRFFALWDGFLAAHPDYFTRIDAPQKLAQVKASGKAGIILGLQNSEHFRTADDVEVKKKKNLDCL